MSVYARHTGVPVERSRGEIESILGRYGATAFGYMADQTKAMIQFQAKNIRIRFILPMPSPEDPEIKFKTHRGEVRTWLPRSSSNVKTLLEQSCRQRWRALALAIKAKLEAVQAGIATFEDEFMAHIVLPGGKTVSETITPSIETAYKTGQVPNLIAWEGPRGKA